MVEKDSNRNNEISENSITIMNFAILMVMLGFVIGIYLIFFKPALILLFYFMIGFWVFALILVFLGIGYYLFLNYRGDIKLNFEELLRTYL